MQILVEDASIGDECNICDGEASIAVPIIDACFCKKCARKLAQVIRQEVS